MSIYTPNQRELAEKLSTNEVTPANRKDWRWQLKHSIQSLAAVERLLNIRFSPEEKVELEKTIERFPLSVTPYYLSLINADDYRNTQISGALESMNVWHKNLRP
jgi:lysine 2,3-aminomutase